MELNLKLQSQSSQAMLWTYKTQLPHCQIWQNKTTSTVAQAYPIPNTNVHSCHTSRNKPHLVNSLGCITDPKTSRVYLLIQRIPNRLSEVHTLNEGQALKVLYSVLRGIEQLFEVFGVLDFELESRCVCFNQVGKVKVWLNGDLSSLMPANEHKLDRNRIKVNTQTDKYRNPRKIESNFIQLHKKVIQNIIKIIQQKSFNSHFLNINNFRQKVQNKQIVSLRQAAEQIQKIAQILFIDVGAEDPEYSTSTSSTSLNNHTPPVLQPPTAPTYPQSSFLPNKDTGNKRLNHVNREGECNSNRRLSTVDEESIRNQSFGAGYLRVGDKGATNQYHHTRINSQYIPNKNCTNIYSIHHKTAQNITNGTRNKITSYTTHQASNCQAHNNMNKCKYTPASTMTGTSAKSNWKKKGIQQQHQRYTFKQQKTPTFDNYKLTKQKSYQSSKNLLSTNNNTTNSTKNIINLNPNINKNPNNDNSDPSSYSHNNNMNLVSDIDRILHKNGSKNSNAMGYFVKDVAGNVVKGEKMVNAGYPVTSGAYTCKTPQPNNNSNTNTLKLTPKASQPQFKDNNPKINFNQRNFNCNFNNKINAKVCYNQLTEKVKEVTSALSSYSQWNQGKGSARRGDYKKNLAAKSQIFYQGTQNGTLYQNNNTYTCNNKQAYPIKQHSPYHKKSQFQNFKNTQGNIRISPIKKPNQGKQKITKNANSPQKYVKTHTRTQTQQVYPSYMQNKDKKSHFFSTNEQINKNTGSNANHNTNMHRSKNKAVPVMTGIPITMQTSISVPKQDNSHDSNSRDKNNKMSSLCTQFQTFGMLQQPQQKRRRQNRSKGTVANIDNGYNENENKQKNRANQKNNHYVEEQQYDYIRQSEQTCGFDNKQLQIIEDILGCTNTSNTVYVDSRRTSTISPSQLQNLSQPATPTQITEAKPQSGPSPQSQSNADSGPQKAKKPQNYNILDYVNKYVSSIQNIDRVPEFGGSGSCVGSEYSVAIRTRDRGNTNTSLNGFINAIQNAQNYKIKLADGRGSRDLQGNSKPQGNGHSYEQLRHMINQVKIKGHQYTNKHNFEEKHPQNTNLLTNETLQQRKSFLDRKFEQYLKKKNLTYLSVNQDQHQNQYQFEKQNDQNYLGHNKIGKHSKSRSNIEQINQYQNGYKYKFKDERDGNGERSGSRERTRNEDLVKNNMRNMKIGRDRHNSLLQNYVQQSSPPNKNMQKHQTNNAKDSINYSNQARSSFSYSPSTMCHFEKDIDAGVYEDYVKYIL